MVTVFRGPVEQTWNGTATWPEVNENAGRVTGGVTTTFVVPEQLVVLRKYSILCELIVVILAREITFQNNHAILVHVTCSNFA